MNQTKSLQRFASYYMSGPLPPPEMLGRYNDVVPNGAERIMAMAEKQQAHRHSLENSVVNSNISSERRGQWMGLFLCVVIVGLGSYLAYIGRELAGSIFIGSDLAALAGVFVYSKHRQRKELREKEQQFRHNKS